LKEFFNLIIWGNCFCYSG